MARRAQVRLDCPPAKAPLLFNELRPESHKPARREIDARTMAAWKWIDAHDLLLELERSLNPYEYPRIEGKLLDDSSSMLAIAEIDRSEPQIYSCGGRSLAPRERRQAHHA